MASRGQYKPMPKKPNSKKPEFDKYKIKRILCKYENCKNYECHYTHLCKTCNNHDTWFECPKIVVVHWREPWKYIIDPIKEFSTTVLVSSTEPVATIKDTPKLDIYKIMSKPSSEDAAKDIEAIAQKAVHLVTFAQQTPAYEDAFRLELVAGTKLTDLWTLHLCLNPEPWFRNHLCNGQDPRSLEFSKLDEVIKNASGYCAEAHSTGLKILDETRRTLPTPGELPVHASNAPFTCYKPVQKKDGIESSCGWYGLRDLYIHNLSKLPFVVLARPNAMRDALFAPMPPLHLTNVDMVATAQCWCFVLDTIKLIEETLGEKGDADCRSPAVTCIAFNFGVWESASADDHNTIDCHAHGHILLSMEAVKKCNKETYPELRGRYENPPNYREQDAVKLENNILSELRQFHEMQSIKNV